MAGDAALIKSFLLYRTYHGGAMSPAVQAASVAAWGDEDHVIDNRRQYREKFAAVTPLLAQVLDVALPDAAFYLWAGVPRSFEGRVSGLSSDEAFARELLAQYNVTVLPGSYLARAAGGVNPGAGRVRMAPGGRARRMPGSRRPHRALLPSQRLNGFPTSIAQPSTLNFT